MRNTAIILLAILQFFTVLPSSAQTPDCKIRNKSVLCGEELVYNVYYNWGMLWVHAADVVFTVKPASFGGKGCYNLKGIGNSMKKFDWFYKVRDRYECFTDSVTLRPYRYIRDTKEGGNRVFNDNLFNYDKLQVYSTREVSNGKIVKDTIAIRECTFDALSMIYVARNIDFGSYKPNDTIPISLFMDEKAYDLVVKYLGKEVIESELGKFRCIKFSPKLIAGSIFSEGNQMVVWVTDDDNKIPLLVETPIIVGSIKSKIKSYTCLRNPEGAKVK